MKLFMLQKVNTIIYVSGGIRQHNKIPVSWITGQKMEMRFMNKNEILGILSKMKHNRFYNIKMGLAGSYARGDNTDSSDIDIVVDTDLMPITDMDYIKSSFYGIDVDVLLLGLLKQEDEEMDNFFKEMDLPTNDESVYKNVLKEVVWCE